MTLHFAMLGDSIAYGQGASSPADTIGARLAGALRAGGTPTELKVFAVPRSRSDALAGQVRQALAWPAELAVIMVGANDLTHFVPYDHAAAQLEDAVRRLRAAGAQVVVAPAPDMSVVPWVPVQLRGMVAATSGLLRGAQTRAALVAGARVADDGTASAAFAGDLSMFSADRFHPSSGGYRLIAQSLEPAVRAAVADLHRKE